MEIVVQIRKVMLGGPRCEEGWGGPEVGEAILTWRTLLLTVDINWALSITDCVSDCTQT